MKTKTKKVKTNKIIRCKDGCHLDDVLMVKVSNAIDGSIKYKYTCKKCRQSLMPSNNTNLIGNPFDIVELRDEYKDAAVFAEIDKVFAA